MPFYRLNKEYNQQGIYMPAGTHNYFKQSRGKNVATQDIDRARNGTQVAKSISFLTDQGINHYSFLIKPVKTSYTKAGNEISKILKFNATSEAKTTEELQKDQTLKERAKQEAQETLNFISETFRPKLLTSQEVKTDTYISLPLPAQIPTESLNIEYSVDKLGIAGAGYNLGMEAQDSFGNDGALADAATSAGAYLARTLLQNIDSVRGITTLSLGNIANPFSANIFENVEPRNFRLDWPMLQPKNKEESDNLREIINLLRYFALPQPDGLLLKTPHEFELAFLGTNYLYSFSRCVLTNIEVNYAPNGFNVFTTEDAPQAVSLSLSFKEIFPLNKEVILSSGGESMYPKKYKEFGQDTSQSDKAVETSVSANQAEIEKEINQKVADWLAKDTERRKLIAERDKLNAVFNPIEYTFLTGKLLGIEISMNNIKEEVDALQAKINYKDRTGRTLKPLPSR
jgi:hypothetical protein